MSEHNANEMLKIYPYLNYYNAKKNQDGHQITEHKLNMIGNCEDTCTSRKQSVFTEIEYFKVILTIYILISDD